MSVEPINKRKTKEQDVLRVPYLLQMEYEYALGQHAIRFFHELKENRRIMGVRCPECQRVYIPPRPVCGICYVPSTEWVEVSDEGVLIGCTVVRLPFIDPMTGEQRPVPYGFGIIRLDGASTSMFHFVDETDDAKLTVGMRVKANFREPREGNMRDITNFRVIGQAQ